MRQNSNHQRELGNKDVNFGQRTQSEYSDVITLES